MSENKSQPRESPSIISGFNDQRRTSIPITPDARGTPNIRLLDRTSEQSISHSFKEESHSERRLIAKTGKYDQKNERTPDKAATRPIDFLSIATPPPLNNASIQ